MQPTYLPWSGYFNLIHRADKFVFLDDVQYEKQSWQSRNRIILQGKEHLLAVPVAQSSLDTPINGIAISNRAPWQKKHWMTLQAAYGKAPHGSCVLDVLERFYTGTAPESLSELNQGIIRSLASALGLETEFVRSSDLACEGIRSKRLINICEKLGCDEYLSPVGSRQYLLEDRFEELSAIGLSFQVFVPAPYEQYRSTAFVSHLSIVDVMANLGADPTRIYIS